MCVCVCLLCSKCFSFFCVHKAFTFRLIDIKKVINCITKLLSGPSVNAVDLSEICKDGGCHQVPVRAILSGHPRDS